MNGESETPPDEVTKQRMRAIGRQVRQRRLDHGLTQDTLARRGGISRPELSRIESGTARPTVAMLYRLADALHCHIRALIPD